MKKILFTALNLIAALFLSCAHQMPPGGGPVDKTPPAVLSSSPAQNAVNVAKGATITILFSEWLTPANVRRSVSLFPSVKNGIEVNVSGRRLIVQPRSKLSDSTTYHLEINATLIDLRNNSIGTPYQLIFSTGPVLDSAQIAGCVIDPKQRLQQPKIALFKTPLKEPPDSIFGMPDYLTQTDSFGVFRFTNIRKGTYRAIAFIDGNNDGRLQQNAEQAYAPLREMVEAKNSADTIIFFPVSADSATPQIVSLEQTAPLVIVGKWNRRPDSTSGVSPIVRWRIEKKDGSPGVPIKEYLLFRDKLAFALRLLDKLPKAQYSLIYSVDKKAPVKSTFTDTLSLRITDTTDTMKPSIFSSSAGNIVQDLAPRIRLVWSEPVRFLRQIFTARDSLGDTASFTVPDLYGDTVVMSPSGKLRPGEKYRIKLLLHDIEDLAGNRAGSADTTDSMNLVLRLTAISADSMCYKLSGGAFGNNGTSCLPPDPRRKWQFTLINDRRSFISLDSSGYFNFDSIPAGKGTVSYFSDYNNDSIPEPGNLFPWIAPEPYVPLYDTIEARARWEVEGVKVPACDACGDRGYTVKKQAAPAKKPAAPMF